MLLYAALVFAVMRAVGWLVDESPIGKRWAREDRARCDAYATAEREKALALQLRCEAEARRAAAREQRMIERGAVRINGELCPVKRVGGKEWIKVRGQWQRYV